MYSKKKEKQPLETITTIKNILNNVGIYMTESWTNPKNIAFSTVFSLRINIFGIGRYGTNGKGTTPEYAIASAYGEMMERLQTGHLLKNPSKYSPEEFIIAPDKVNLSRKEFLELNNTFLNTDFRTITKRSFLNPEIDNLKNNKELLDFWLDKVDFGAVDYVICLPYYSVKEKDEVLLPQSIIRSAQASNGMCAGNTPEEALVQGFSEILERVALTEILTEELTPPIIPESEYIYYEELHKMLNYFKKLGFEVQIRDCSLGKQYPVISAALINKQAQTYKISFGAHPYLPIAIERCLTEIGQGMNLENPETVERTFSDLAFYSIDQSGTATQIRNTVTTGIVKVSPKFFTGQTTWSFEKDTWCGETVSNKALLDNLTEICLKNCENIYIRDFSYLGFPTYQIVIPEMTPTPEDYKIYNYLRMVYTTQDVIDRYKTQEGLNEIYTALKSVLHSNYYVDYMCIVKNLPNILLAIDCCIKLNKLDEALLYIEKVLLCREKYESYISLEEINCLKTLIRLRQNNYSDEDLLNILQTFYPLEVIKNIFNIWVSENTLEKLLENNAKNKGDINPYLDSENIKIAYAKVEQVKQNLLEAYKSNLPNQKELKKLFNNK